MSSDSQPLPTDSTATPFPWQVVTHAGVTYKFYAEETAHRHLFDLWKDGTGKLSCFGTNADVAGGKVYHVVDGQLTEVGSRGA